MTDRFLDFDQYQIPDSIDIKGQNIPDEVKLISICEKEDGDKHRGLLDKILGSLGNVKYHSIYVDSDEMLRVSEMGLNKEGLILLAFGVSPKRLGLNMNVAGYQLIRTDNGLSFVFTHKLEKIDEDKSKKLRLWNILKEIA